MYFSAGFSDKTVPCTMNELYLTGATHEAACAHCTMGKYGRKLVTQTQTSNTRNSKTVAVGSMILFTKVLDLSKIYIL